MVPQTELAYIPTDLIIKRCDQCPILSGLLHTTYIMRGCRVQALDDALLIDNDEEILMADDEANEQVPSSEYLVIDIESALS